MRYEIFEGNMERLEKKLATISRKCEKHGCEFRYEVVGETFRDVKDGDRKVKARFVIVEAEGTAKMNGWQFVATLDHTEKGNVIRSVAGFEVPERYYYSTPVCEHCNSKRSRKNTYIVLNTETGEYKQVGRSCLKEFTNGLSAEAVAQYISWFDEIIRGEEVLPGSSFRPYYKTEEMLQYAAETVLKFGYTPNSAFGRTTALRTADYYRLDNGMLVHDARMVQEELEESGYDKEDPQAKKMAQEVLQFVQDHEDDTNYFHNLKVVLSREYISGKEVGILCSSIPAYNREVAYRERKEREKAENAGSEFVGEVGQRVAVHMASIKAVTGWETQWGYTFIYKMVDDEGNVFTWKTSNRIEAESGTVKGTIKGHNEFRGTKQTELTRCKVLEAA